MPTFDFFFKIEFFYIRWEKDNNLRIVSLCTCLKVATEHIKSPYCYRYSFMRCAFFSKAHITTVISVDFKVRKSVRT